MKTEDAQSIIDQLKGREAQLLLALQDAHSGVNRAYECVSNGLYDEALLHLGVHGARIARAIS